MGEQQLVVLAHGKVHFQGHSPQILGFAHGRNGVFGHQAAAAEVALPVLKGAV